jgi:hypothetical protein
MSADRRRAPRIELLGRLHGRIVPYDLTVAVRNVSLGGLLFAAPMEFPVGVVHDFRLMLGDETTVLLRGTVLRSTEEQDDSGDTVYVTAVEFVDEAAGDGPGIEDLIDRLE